MPSPRKNIRTYCKTCKDFMIHEQTQGIGEDLKLSCCTCETIGEPYNWQDLDSEIVEQQRLRYKEQKTRKVGKLFTAFATLGALPSLSSIGIVEDDAGQKAIDEKAKQERLERIEKRKEQVAYFEETYKGLGRNDKCACGSGKKYKSCHLPIYVKAKIAN